jgi:hypothetical protein
MSAYWPFWLGGLALAIVALGYWGALGRLLGVSGSFSNVLGRPRPANATLLVALVAGGALGAWSRGAWHLHTGFGADFTRVIGGGWRGVAVLLLGGVLVGFGTQMAGGCTSGHGLCGTSRLQRGSLVATASFFGAAVAVSLVLLWWAR